MGVHVGEVRLARGIPPHKGSDYPKALAPGTWPLLIHWLIPNPTEALKLNHFSPVDKAVHFSLGYLLSGALGRPQRDIQITRLPERSGIMFSMHLDGNSGCFK